MRVEEHVARTGERVCVELPRVSGPEHGETIGRKIAVQVVGSSFKNVIRLFVHVGIGV